MDRVIDAAQAVAIPADQKVLHILPQEFIVASQDGIKEPIGMSGVRLESRVPMVTGAVSAAQNIIKCVRRCGLEVDDFLLEQLASSLANGTINIVDLTHPLGPQTPMIKVPEGHRKQPPAVQLEPIADYRDKSGYARWSTLIVAEHAGTHFDAPGHWFTGEKFKDGTTDTINAKRFVAPASVIDCTEAVERDPSFILDVQHLQDWVQ